MTTLVLDTPIGPLTVVAAAAGVLRIGFGATAEVVDPDTSAEAARLAASAVSELDAYFAGRRTTFEVLLDRSVVSGFRAVVLEELTTVPYGDVVSYGELARRVGRPGAARAVGTAMATNPWPIVVPCHRVVRTGGALGAYGGGEGAKRWLVDVEHDRAHLAPSP